MPGFEISDITSVSVGSGNLVLSCDPRNISSRSRAAHQRIDEDIGCASSREVARLRDPLGHPRAKTLTRELHRRKNV